MLILVENKGKERENFKNFNGLHTFPIYPTLIQVFFFSFHFILFLFIPFYSTKHNIDSLFFKAENTYTISLTKRNKP